MNNVNINYSTSGLGAPAAGEDFISGMIFYTNAYPSGFSSTAQTADILSLSQAEGLGITANTLVNVSAATNLDILHYHISEFFRANPTGELWTMIQTSASTGSYAEVVQLNNASGGKIRQIGIWEAITFASSNLAAIQTQVTSTITNNKPLEVIYTANFSAVTDLTTLTDLSTLNAPNVSVAFGQDGANLGAALYTKLSKTIGCVGLALGAVSSALVSESIAWVQNFNMSNVEMDTLAFGNGSLYTAASDNLVSQIDIKQYLFLRKFVGISGSYFNNDYTAISVTSDYSSIKRNRTIHKAAREVRARLLPSVAAPIFFNADGTISAYSIGFFESEANTALAAMVSASEISQYKTIINPKQNVQSTKILNLTVQIVPVGSADVIDVNLGFVLSV